MKVILLKDVGGVGQRGSVKEVADGYALNFLIPHGLAEQATSEKIAAHEAAQKKSGEKKVREAEALAANIKSLEGARIEVAAKATEKGGLFKSLGTADIQKAIREEKGIEVPQEAIALQKPVKEVGEHALVVKNPDAEARISLVVKAQG